jgi:hypothetical protein
MKWLFWAMSVVYGYDCIAVLQTRRIEVMATDATGATLNHLDISAKSDLRRPLGARTNPSKLNSGKPTRMWGGLSAGSRPQGGLSFNRRKACWKQAAG